MRGLLEANGVPSVITSDVPHNIFPLMVNGLGEVRISVRDDDADDARRIIDRAPDRAPERPARSPA